MKYFSYFYLTISLGALPSSSSIERPIVPIVGKFAWSESMSKKQATQAKACGYGPEYDNFL
jgi:hypothetical protein